MWLGVCRGVVVVLGLLQRLKGGEAGDGGGWGGGVEGGRRVVTSDTFVNRDVIGLTYRP